MNPKEKRERMDTFLKSIVVPEIKALGFFGSFPHFRRERNGRFEFLSFQFNRHSGSFVLECGFASQADLPEFAQELPFEKLDYGHTHHQNRTRIQPDGTKEDFWFPYEDFIEDTQFEGLAMLVKSLLPKVEQFFQ